MTTDRKPMVKLAELWQRTSVAGKVYYSGFMGGCQVLMLDDGEHPHPTREGETVRVWKLLLQERDQQPRQPQRQAQPARGRDRAVLYADPPPRERQRDRASAAGRAILDHAGRKASEPPPFDDEIPF